MTTAQSQPPRPEKPKGTIISFQSMYDDIPEYLVEVKQLFESIKAQRQKYLDEAGGLCKTLTPKESFMTRLRLIDVLRSSDPGDGYACQEEENIGDSFKFSFLSDGNFTISDDERAFVEDDPRYKVTWGDVECEDHDVFTMNAILYLGMKEHKRVIEEEHYDGEVYEG
jgi:hypothetical protein